MSIAPLVIREMLWADDPPPGVVVPFPRPAFDPAECRRRTLKRLRRLSHCPGTISEAHALLSACAACRGCFHA